MICNLKLLIEIYEIIYLFSVENIIMYLMAYPQAEIIIEIESSF